MSEVRRMIQKRGESGLPLWRHNCTNNEIREAADDGWMDVNGWEPVMEPVSDLRQMLQKRGEFLEWLWDYSAHPDEGPVVMSMGITCQDIAEKAWSIFAAVAPIKCDHGEACPGHASPDERPCGYEEMPPLSAAELGYRWICGRLNGVKKEQA